MADAAQPVEQEAASVEVLDAAPLGRSTIAAAMERQHEELDHFTPGGRALVIADPDDRTGVLQVLDRHDELLIMERIQAKATRKLFYSFRVQGQLVTELSVQGVQEAIGEMNATGKVQIGIDPEIRPEFEVELADTDFAGDVQHVVCTVYARDRRTGVGANGTFSQPRKFKLTDKTAKYRKQDGKFVPDDQIVTDPFARQKALNKAERNALRKLIPEFIAQTLIASYLGDASLVQQIKVGPGAAAVAELPAPLTDDEAVAIVEQARELYTDLLGFDRGGILTRFPPASFHAYLTRSEHSHDRLRDFVKYVEGKRDEAKVLAAAQPKAGG